jgi:hypothetical protein
VHADGEIAIVVDELRGRLQLSQPRDRDLVAGIGVIGADDEVVEPRDRSEQVQHRIVERRGSVPVQAR